MKQLQFVFDGGLGNQIFQYFALKYIQKNFPDFNFKCALSDHILNGYRSFELNLLVKKHIEINKEFNQYGEKIYSRMINNIPILSKFQKRQFKSKIDFINCLYNEKDYFSNKNTLLTLSEDLSLIKESFNKLKVKGFWQNPSCYIEDLSYFRNLLIDTQKIVYDNLLPNEYITIHIRRGDYLSKKNLFERYYTKFSPVKFILLSLNLLPQDSELLPIYIISDDQKWANSLVDLLSARKKNKFFTLETKNDIEDWAILRHSSINICSNSTFSYTAALLNTNNLDRKLRCIIPQWIANDKSSFEKGWLTPEGFIEI